MASPALNTPFQPYVYQVGSCLCARVSPDSLVLQLKKCITSSQSPQAAITPFQILGGEAQIVQFLLKPGESVRAEPGSMCYMSPNMEVQTHMEAGSFSRWLSGESFFLNSFINRGPGEAFIGIATPTMSKILPVDLALFGGQLLCQRDSYLCSLHDVTVAAQMPRRVRVGLFAIGGFFFQRLSGRGLAFITAGGSIVQKSLAPGEVVVVDAGCVLAFSPTVDLDLRYVGSIKRALFGGEGLFHAHLTGPGVVFLQSLPFQRLAYRVNRSLANAQLKEFPLLWIKIFLSIVLSIMLAVLSYYLHMLPLEYEI